MTQEEHDKYQSKYKECCILLGNLDEKKMTAILEILKLSQQQYPDTEAGGVVFCGKCGKAR